MCVESIVMSVYIGLEDTVIKIDTRGLQSV